MVGALPGAMARATFAMNILHLMRVREQANLPVIILKVIVILAAQNPYAKMSRNALVTQNGKVMDDTNSRAKLDQK